MESIIMKEVKNLDSKRICDISADERVIEIRKKGCITQITVNPDRTLRITQEFAKSGKQS